jgi:hypothetical protein
MDFSIALILLVVIIIAYFPTRQLFIEGSRNWVKLIYSKHPEVDFSKVKQFVLTKKMPTEEFTYWEIVAVFGLLLKKEDVSAVHKKATLYGGQGWDKKYNYDFYNEILITAKKISLKGKKESARRLLMLGKRLAENYNENEWAERYWQILETGYKGWSKTEMGLLKKWK